MGKQVKLYHNTSVIISLPYQVEVDGKIEAAFNNREDAEKFIHDNRMNRCRQKAAQAWCKARSKDKTMDPELAESFAEILMEVGY